MQTVIGCTGCTNISENVRWDHWSGWQCWWSRRWPVCLIFISVHMHMAMNYISVCLSFWAVHVSPMHLWWSRLL